MVFGNKHLAYNISRATIARCETRLRFYIKMIILLRPARDKHRKHNDGEGVFCRNLFVRNGAVRFGTRIVLTHKWKLTKAMISI
jgi:hypothetical protein